MSPVDDRIDTGAARGFPAARPAPTLGARDANAGAGESGSLETVRIAGVRLGAPVVRLLSEILESEGYPETAGKLADAIEQQVTVEAPLTADDYGAIAEALGRNCPATLYRLRAQLLEWH